MKTLALALLATVSATAVSAQSLPDCKGQYEVIRADQIKAGKFDEFKKAVADHQAWYKSHGYGDKILLGQVLKPNAQDGSPAFSADIALTIHTNMSTPAGPAPHDAGDEAWNAYVAEYQDSSTIMNTTIACVAEVGE